VLAITARHVLEREVVAELSRVVSTGAISERVFELVDEARGLGLAVDLARARPAMRDAVRRSLEAVAAECVSERVAVSVALVRGAERLQVGFGRWAAQNRFFELWRTRPDAHDVLLPLATALGFDLPRDGRR
jgi:hypothetical protein